MLHFCKTSVIFVQIFVRYVFQALKQSIFFLKLSDYFPFYLSFFLSRLPDLLPAISFYFTPANKEAAALSHDDLFNMLEFVGCAFYIQLPVTSCRNRSSVSVAGDNNTIGRVTCMYNLSISNIDRYVSNTSAVTVE